MSWISTAKLNTRAGFTWWWWNKPMSAYCIIVSVPIFVDSKTVFHDELAISRGSVFLLFLCGRRERVWNFICLSKWCDLQKGQSFQDMFNSLSSLAFNTMFIIRYAPEFIFFCQAVGKNNVLRWQTLFYVWIFLTVILCVNFFLTKLYQFLCWHLLCFFCWFFLICFQLSESVNHPFWLDAGLKSYSCLKRP